MTITSSLRTQEPQMPDFRGWPAPVKSRGTAAATALSYLRRSRLAASLRFSLVDITLLLSSSSASCRTMVRSMGWSPSSSSTAGFTVSRNAEFSDRGNGAHPLGAKPKNNGNGAGSDIGNLVSSLLKLSRGSCCCWSRQWILNQLDRRP